MGERETLGERVQRFRQERGMSQPALADASGMPVGSLRNIEQGRRVPRLDTAKALADALGVTLDALTEGVAFTLVKRSGEGEGKVTRKDKGKQSQSGPEAAKRPKRRTAEHRKDTPRQGG